MSALIVLGILGSMDLANYRPPTFGELVVQLAVMTCAASAAIACIYLRGGNAPEPAGD